MTNCTGETQNVEVHNRSSELQRWKITQGFPYILHPPEKTFPILVNLPNYYINNKNV